MSENVQVGKESARLWKETPVAILDQTHKKYYLLTYFWLCRVFIAACRPSVVAVELLIVMPSLAEEHRLWGAQAQWWSLVGVIDPRRVESSQSKDRTRVLCVGRWILNPWATKEVLDQVLGFLGKVGLL